MTTTVETPELDALDALALGDRVTFTWTLTRKSERREVERFGRKEYDWWKVWKPEAYPGQPEPAPREGILIGVRTLANGPVEHNYEEGTTFDTMHAERFKAYLVAYGLHRKPVQVLPEHLRVGALPRPPAVDDADQMSLLDDLEPAVPDGFDPWSGGVSGA